MFLYYKKYHYEKFEKFLNYEAQHFGYGYSNSLNLTLLSIIMVYSIHIPLLVLFGILYFIIWLYIDVYHLLSTFK